MRKKFKKFMKVRELWKPWKKYYKRTHCLVYEHKEFLKHTDPKKYIITAFDWRCTKEGLNFWRDINEEWEDEVENKIGKV